MFSSLFLSVQRSYNFLLSFSSSILLLFLLPYFFINFFILFHNFFILHNILRFFPFDFVRFSFSSVFSAWFNWWLNFMVIVLFLCISLILCCCDSRLWFCYFKGIQIYFFPDVFLCLLFILASSSNLAVLFIFSHQLYAVCWFIYWCFCYAYWLCVHLTTNLLISLNFVLLFFSLVYALKVYGKMLQWILINISLTRFDVVFIFFIHKYFNQFVYLCLICFDINSIHI